MQLSVGTSNSKGIAAMSVSNAGMNMHTSPLMRVLTALVVFVYTTVLVSPGVQAAQQVGQSIVDDNSARRAREENAHARILDDTVRELRSLRQKRSQSRSLAAVQDDRSRLKQLRDGLRAQNVSAREELQSFEAQLREWNVGEEIIQRHRAALEQLNKDATELEQQLDEVATLHAADALDTRIEALLNRFGTMPTRNAHQRFDPKRMPYRPASGKARAPKSKPEELAALFPLSAEPRMLLASSNPQLDLIVGALAAPTAVAPEYLSANEDVQLTAQIREMAQALGPNPVAIYNWVRNNIDYVPSYGSIQGSELTLQNAKGNAYDIASLLIALYRTSGIAARYAYGTVEVPIESVMNWVGVSTPDQAQEIIGQGGIPNVAVTSGGKVKSLRFEHVWVEAWIDFVPSRGAKHVEGDTWVALDPSFKQYVVEEGLDLAAGAPFDATGALAQITATSGVDDQAGVINSLDVAQLKTRFYDYQVESAAALNQSHPNATSIDLLDRRYIQASTAPTLPAGLPYRKFAAGNTYAQLPAALRHSVTIASYASVLDRSEDLPQLSRTISLPALGLKRLSVAYRPASDADAQVINAAIDNGSTSLPAYLIRVVPQLKLDETVLVEGPAVTMGTAQFWAARLTGPISASSGEVPFDHTVAGDLLVFSIDGSGIGGTAATIRRSAFTEPNAAEDLHFAGLSFWTAHNLTDRLTADGMGGRMVRLPSVALLSAGFTPRYFFGVPRQASYLGRMLDARRVTISAVAPTDQLRKAIVMMAGIQGSQWEASAMNSVFARKERMSMSATEYIAYATTHGVPIQVVAPDNLSTAIANLQVSADVIDDVSAAVQSGMVAILPQRDLNIRGRVGNGYIILDPQTGAGAYLIDGGLNGGLEAPCKGPSATPPTMSTGGDSAPPTGLAAMGFSAAALPAVASTIPNIIHTEANLVRITQIAQAANDSVFMQQARAAAPRMGAQVAFRLVAGGFVMAIGAAFVASVIVATAYSIAILITHHLVQIELALLAAENGGDEAVHPVPGPAAEPNPDEDDCDCTRNPQLPKCKCTFTQTGIRGGNNRHNECVNTMPTRFPNQETDVCTPQGVCTSYDAALPDGVTYCEVKTYDFDKNKFVVEELGQLEVDRASSIKHQIVAAQCGINYCYVVADPRHEPIVRGWGTTADIRVRPECLLFPR
jgi:transglutaminase-like putative cysteine protease